MIWFGHLTLQSAERPPVDRARPELARMEMALRWVAARAPELRGETLAAALVSAGWVDLEEARRLLPLFSRFDADRHFADELRRLSFRGMSVLDEFHGRIGRVLVDLAGRFALDEVAGERCLRFRDGEREGLVFAYPRVGLSLGPGLTAALRDAAETMPDSVVIVARSFRPDFEAQVRGLMHGTDVPCTLITVNRLLGVRAVALAYRPPRADVLGLFEQGGLVGSAAVAHLADRSVRVAGAGAG